jgi:hypothetical protein
MNSRRRLPHSYPEGRWLFITWTLHGSFSPGRFPPPAKATSSEAVATSGEAKATSGEAKATSREGGATSGEAKATSREGVATSGEAMATSSEAAATSGEAMATSGEAFAWIDRYLDNTRTGPQYLRQPSIAQVVIDSLFRGIDLGHYDLGPFAIMPNHVHVLLKPLVAPSRLLKSLKGSTARESNRLLYRTGEQFWQRESYDHWVRDQQEWDRIARYIERNPMKAGLASRVEEYPWSSANPKFGVQKNAQQDVHTSVNAARMSACATKESDSARTSACATEESDSARTSACSTATAKILA